MGYEVNVTGKIKFKDVEAFKKAFKKIAQHRRSEVGLHEDFDYFFTKMWGDNLENLEIDENGSVEIRREGKLWYDEDKAMKFLAKYAHGTIESEGEDGRQWRYVISEDGCVKRQTGKVVYD